MDFSDPGNILFIAVIVGLVLLQFFLRRRRSPATTQQAIVESLLSEVRVNIQLVEILTLNSQSRKFMTTSWMINQNKLEFLNQELQGDLSDAFTIAEDFNQQLSIAKKHKTSGYIPSIDVGKLKEKLTKSREGLEEWLFSKTGTKEPQPKYPSMTDFLFGSRR